MAVVKVFPALLAIVFLILLGSKAVMAEEIRIARPLLHSGYTSCCAQAQISGNGSKISWPGSIVEQHRHWQIRYGQPVFCPVMTCGGSCGASADGCVLRSGVLLVGGSGCAGSCK